MGQLIFSARGFCICFVGVLITAVIGCSDATQVDCSGTVDSLEVVDEREYNGTHYYLVKKIAGWHDKVVVLQLFDKKPEFDQCNESVFPPVIEDSLDPELSVDSFRIDLTEKVFLIEYAEEGAVPEKVNFDIRFVDNSKEVDR